MLACLTQALCDGFVKYVGNTQPIYTQVMDNNFVTYIKCENYQELSCEDNDGNNIYAASQDDSILNQIESNCSSSNMIVKSSSDAWNGYYSLPSCPYLISEFEGQYAFHFYYYDYEEQEQEQQVYIGENISNTETNKWFYQIKSPSMVNKSIEMTVGDNTRYLIEPTNEQDIKCGVDYTGMEATPYNCSLVVITPEEEGQEQQEEEQETPEDKPAKQSNSYEKFFFATFIMGWFMFVLVVITFILIMVQHCSNTTPIKNIFPTKPVGGRF